VKQVCRRLNCDSNTVYRLIESGALTAANTARPGAGKSTYLVYRWSLIEHISQGLEGDWGSRGEGRGTNGRKTEEGTTKGARR